MRKIHFIVGVVLVVGLISCTNKKFPEPCDCAEILKIDNPDLEKACMDKTKTLNRWQLKQWNEAVLSCNQPSEK